MGTGADVELGTAKAAVETESEKAHKSKGTYNNSRSEEWRRKGPLDEMAEFMKSAKQQESSLRQNLRKGHLFYLLLLTLKS